MKTIHARGEQKCWRHGNISTQICRLVSRRPGRDKECGCDHSLHACALDGEPWATGWVVCIQQSKASTRFARLQSVVIEDQALLQLASETFGSDPPTRYQVSGGVRELAKSFISIKALLGLAGTPYVLAGYRGGGACEYLRRTANLSYLQFRGRWATVKSMWHYLQLGLAASTFRAVPAATQTLVLELAACASDVF
eukprot:3383526-Amphidinium_carterae.1